MTERIVKFFIGAIIVAAIFFAGFGEAVLQLWNWLMPAVFGLHRITYWEAIGLLLLSWILFGGQRGWLMGRGRSRRRERWAHLSPEERERFRAAVRDRCGNFSNPATEAKA